MCFSFWLAKRMQRCYGTFCHHGTFCHQGDKSCSDANEVVANRVGTVPFLYLDSSTCDGVCVCVCVCEREREREGGRERVCECVRARARVCVCVFHSSVCVP